MRRTLLACALCASCSEVRLDLLEPHLDASVDAANDIDAALADDTGVIDASLSGLVVRYDFAGSGSALRDRVGDASAVVRGGASLDDSGVLALDGVDDYVDLPNGTLASLESATLVSWLSWSGGVCWQRVLDFGFNDMPEGTQGFARASLFVTFSTCPEGKLAARAELPAQQQVYTALSDASLPSDRPMQIALVFDGERGRMRLYLDAVPMADTAVGFPLSSLQDVNAWIGRSQWIQDHFTRARLDEFRIYDRPLSDAEMRTTFSRGPDAP